MKKIIIIELSCESLNPNSIKRKKQVWDFVQHNQHQSERIETIQFVGGEIVKSAKNGNTLTIDILR